ncbi:CU044_5270 family protein [Microbispora sp. H10830]|uniref:CU044_5270 family protein n=1 Tax=Microbispora sp. H10830 TaxID=2729109 RepID=UPI001600EE1D|nr:CU044_5270 family protein [Microbispora sp. H10830]
MDDLTRRTGSPRTSEPDELAAVRDLLVEPAPTAAAFDAGRARLMAALALAAQDGPYALDDPYALDGDPRGDGAGPGPDHGPSEQEPARFGRGLRQSRARGVRRSPETRSPETRFPGHRFTGRRVTVGALLAGAAAAAALIVTTAVAPEGRVVLTPAPEASAGTPVAETMGGAANARQILLAAASATARTSDEPGAYWRMKTTYIQRFLSPDRRYLLQRGLSEEMWLARDPARPSWRITRPLGVKPATPEDEAAWRDAGSPREWRYPHDVEGLGDVGPGDEVRAAPEEPIGSRLAGGWIGSPGLLAKQRLTWAELDRVPSGTQKLRDYLKARISRQTKKYHALDPRREMDSRLQGACTEILSGLPVSPEVRASAYRILAELPGITAVGEVTDALGRTGQGLTYRAGEEGTDVTMVVDPGSGLFLSRETRSAGVDAGGRTVTVGTFVAYDDSSWSDEEPDLPARHD